MYAAPFIGKVTVAPISGIDVGITANEYQSRFRFCVAVTLTSTAKRYHGDLQVQCPVLSLLLPRQGYGPTSEVQAGFAMGALEQRPKKQSED